MSSISLSILIAVFSETASLLETIKRLLRKNRGYIREIILLVSPHSSQDCLRLCGHLAQENSLVRMHLQERNPGQGFAFREGFTLARGSHIAIMSADLETEPEVIDLMVERIEQTSCRIVTANRWLAGGGFNGYGIFKKMLNFLFQRFFMMLFRTRLSDLTYGFRIFDADVVRAITWECQFHDFALESILKPIKLGIAIEEVPALWKKRKEGKSSYSVLRYGRYFLTGFRIAVSNLADATLS